MRRSYVLLVVLLCASGCASEDGPGFFDAALKDLRGDNMQMRSDSSALKELAGSSSSLKSRD